MPRSINWIEHTPVQATRWEKGNHSTQKAKNQARAKEKELAQVKALNSVKWCVVRVTERKHVQIREPANESGGPVT